MVRISISGITNCAGYILFPEYKEIQQLDKSLIKGPCIWIITLQFYMIFSFVNVIYPMAFMNKDLKINLSVLTVPD